MLATSCETEELTVGSRSATTWTTPLLAEWSTDTTRRQFAVTSYIMHTDATHALTTSLAIAEGPRDASCQLKSCQLPRNSAETACTTSPEPSISCRYDPCDKIVL